MIKIKYLLAAAVLVFVVSCSKSNNGSLSIKIKSISNSIVPVEGGMQIIFDFTEGGSVIDTIGFIKIRTNQVPTPTVRDTIFYTSPDYPKTEKGQLQVNLSYDNDLTSASTPPTTGNPPQNVSDSLIIKFFAKDQANHTSDTVTTGLIVVLR
jgi:hypothetical protein